MIVNKLTIFPKKKIKFTRKVLIPISMCHFSCMLSNASGYTCTIIVCIHVYYVIYFALEVRGWHAIILFLGINHYK